MLKKILSSVVVVSFLLNTISYADVLNVKDRSNVSSNTLAPESRLDPVRTPQLLDIMKLTAEIINLTAETEPVDRKKATSVELPNDLLVTNIDGINLATSHGGVKRPGDQIVFDFRNKATVNNATFIHCWIEGIPHGGTVASPRHYLCAAKNVEGGKYEYEFFANASVELDGNDVVKAIDNIELLTGLSISTSPKATKEGIARFVRQQNDTDRLIAKAIVEDKTAVRLTVENAQPLRDVEAFLRANEFKVYSPFFRLAELGQVMEIPGLKKPHAGGIGIYLPIPKPPKEGAKNTDTAPIIIHEIFAKCGFSHDDANMMMIIFGKINGPIKEALTPDESALLERAKKADFENRYDDVLKIDFYKSGFNVDPNELTGEDRNWFVGIDSSTQSVKIMVIERLPDGTNRVIWTHGENFDDTKYDKFGTTGGVLPHPHAPELHHTDPLMIADALDNCMDQLSVDFKNNGLSMENIGAIAGAGQQHGTVYLNSRAQAILKTGLHASAGSLSHQIRKAAILSFPTSPIWQDGTTSEEVAAINKAGGGADNVRKTTGSPATRRFSLPQILANFKRQPSSGRSTDKVLNIAGWNGALLTGRADFPIDPGDGAGTNAMDIRTNTWWAAMTDKLVPGLSNKLPPIKPSAYVVDEIASYWVNKYGFSRDTQVVNFTGDNPSGLAGMGVIKEGQVVISLGTSYTAYTFVGKEGLEKALEVPIGHVFGETLNADYMNLVCFHNGDQTLEEIRKKLIDEDEALARATKAGIEIPQDAAGKEALIKKMRIEIFTEELEKTKAGNGGAMVVAMHKTEDVVRIPFDASRPFTRNLDMSNRPQVFRAYVEGQAYFMKWVAEQIGLSFTDIKLTGGVSNNPVVRHIFADVFNANVSVLKEGTEAVALGSAIRAMMAHLELTPEEAIKDLTEVDSDKTVTPNAANVTKYNKHYKDFEELLGEAIYSGRIQDVKDYHTAKTGSEPETMAIGPGRINLLGEHTDYAGGMVLPIALDGVDVIAAASARPDGMIVLYSPRYGDGYKISVEALKTISPEKLKGLEAIPDESKWARYPLGVIRQIMEISGVNMEKLGKGLTITYDGNVPLGGGLSSSAAVEMSVFTAVDGILETGLNKKDASVLCMHAEWWQGTECGIMDQFASGNGVKGKAILLNCNTLESQPVDISFLETAGYAIVAVDTGLEKTKEAWEKYTARKADLQTAVDSVLKARFPAIQRVLDIAPNLTPEQFESVGGELKALTDGQRIYNRVKHVVEEEARVMKLAVIAEEANVLAAAVKTGDQSKLGALKAKVEEFGAVISAGHVSLDELYEMSSPYLNQLVKSAKEHGSVGSRFTGAGIVGCTVNLVPKDKLAAFREGVVSEYRVAFGDKPTPKVIVSSAGDGARAIDMGKKKYNGGPAVGSGTEAGAGGRVIPRGPDQRQPLRRVIKSVPLKKETVRAAVSPEATFGYEVSDVSIRGENAVILKREIPKGVKSAVPEIVSATVAPNAGMNLISLKVLFPGQSDPTEVLHTLSPEDAAEFFADGTDNPYGKNAFTEGGPVIGPIPNRAVGSIEDGKVKVVFPNGNIALVPANHEGSTVPKYHLHGFFHRLAQRVIRVASRNAAGVGTKVDVKNRSEEWPWPSDSNIRTLRAITSENKTRLTVVQKNTGTERTWASWVDHSYFKNPLGIRRDDVRLMIPGYSISEIGKQADGQPDYKDCLPTGKILDVKNTEYDFTAPEGRALGRLFLDDSFTNLKKQPDGSVIAEVLYPEIGYKLRIRAWDKVTRTDGTTVTGNLKSIQVYSPENTDFVCVEIGANLKDPFNKKVWGDTDTGMVELSPGDAYEYNYEVEYLPIAAVLPEIAAVVNQPKPAASVVPQEVIDFAEDMAKLGYKISQDGCAGLEDFGPDATGGRNFDVFDLIKARVVRAFTTNNSIMRNILTAMAKAAKETGVNPIAAHINEAIERNPELGKPENQDELLRTVYNNINEVDVAAPLGAALEPIWSETGHRDGYISVEPFTDIVLDGNIYRIVSESIAKFNRIQDEIERTTGARPRNIHLKLPVTEAGLKAGEELVSMGYSVNFTLIATAEQYRAAARAYKAGIRRFVDAAWIRMVVTDDAKKPTDREKRIAKFNSYIKENLPQSVASAFVSRDDRNVYEIINDPTFGKLIEHREFRAAHEASDTDIAYTRKQINIGLQINIYKEAAKGNRPSIAKRILEVFDSLKVKDANGKEVVGVTKVGVAFTKAVMWPIFQEEFEKDAEWLEFIKQRELPKELMSQQIYLASTGVKIDGKYTTNAFYLENLVAPNTTNTIPYPVIYATVKAGKALFKPQVMIDQGVDEANATLKALADVGIDLDLIKNEVIFEDGLKTFGDDDMASLKIIEGALPAARDMIAKKAADGKTVEASEDGKPDFTDFPEFKGLLPEVTQSAAVSSSAVDAEEAQFPEGINATLIDIAASKTAATKIVVFVSQDFAASKDECKRLLPSHTLAEYVPFNQHTQLSALPGLMNQAQYGSYKKVLITSGVIGKQKTDLEAVIESSRLIFRDVILINAAVGQFENVAEEKSFKKGILTMALLAASMPTDPTTYRQSESYKFLKSLLMKIFDHEREAEEYIANLVNPNGALGTHKRFSFLISRIIGPIGKLVVNGFTRLVNIFA